MDVAKADLKTYTAVAGHPLALVGTWVNELGSAIVVDDVTEGLITGSYRSKVSAGETPAEGRLTGFVAGDTIGMVVTWDPTYASVTSWAGKLLATPKGEPCIYSLWTLSRSPENLSGWWESLLAGSATFWRQAG